MKNKNAIEVKAEQKVKIHGKGLNAELGADFIFNSCASYALKYNECPIASYNKEKERGHATHWANACAVCVNGRPYIKPEVTVNIGDTVYFEGRHFEIHPANNGNVHLEEV